MGAASTNEPVLLRCRNRTIRPSDVRFLRETIAAHGEAGRTALARLVCERWEWRTAKGGLKLSACADLLHRLDKLGHIELPVRPRSQRLDGRQPLLPRDLIPLAWSEVTDEDADLGTLVVRPVTPEERLGWRLFIDRYHYLGEPRLVGERLLYAGFLDTRLVALLGWAATTFRLAVRDAFIGWDDEAKRSRLSLTTNNVRFLVPRWVRVRNLASKVLALNLRRLSGDWERAFGHPVHLAETYVDTTRFRGTCYRAANWVYLGESAGPLKGGNTFARGGNRKAVYVYELHRHARRLLRGEGTA